MRNAMIDLNPAELHVVHAGAASFPRSERFARLHFGTFCARQDRCVEKKGIEAASSVNGAPG